MKIAHVSATFPPYWGGTGNVCYQNCRQLARLGHEVHVFTARHPAAPAVETVDGFTVHRLRPLVQLGNAPVLPQLLWKLRGFDVIHLHYPFILGAEMVRLAAWRSRLALVASFHNDLIGDGARASLFSRYQALSARVTVRTVDRLCVVSFDHYDSSRLCQSLLADRPVVVELPNGVDTAIFHPDGPVISWEELGIREDAHIVLFVAAIDRAHHFKGLDKLLRTMASLDGNTWLVVVGDGDMREAYEQQARELGVADRVRFAGAVNHNDTPPFYRAANCTVLPSSPPESFGLVLIESMACGTPVVASNIPGVRAVVEHGQDGVLVELGDVEALAAALNRTLGDEEEQQAMGRRGREKVVLRYSWERIGERLEDIYRSVMSPLPNRET